MNIFTPSAEKRYGVILGFDANNTNPNGDPDGNQPRTLEIGDALFGFMTPSSMNRKIRDTYEALGQSVLITPTDGIDEKTKISNLKTGDLSLRDCLIETFIDVRTFGGVFASFKEIPPLTGAVKFSAPMTVHPVEHPVSVATSRSMAITTKTKKDKESGVESESDTGKLGSHWILPYGFYTSFCTYTPSQGKKSGMTDEDLALFFKALPIMFQETNSSTRNLVMRHVIVFEHESSLGNAPDALLKEKVTFTPTCDSPSSYKDIQVDVDEDLPEGVTMYRLL